MLSINDVKDFKFTLSIRGDVDSVHRRVAKSTKQPLGAKGTFKVFLGYMGVTLAITAPMMALGVLFDSALALAGGILTIGIAAVFPLMNWLNRHDGEYGEDGPRMKEVVADMHSRDQLHRAYLAIMRIHNLEVNSLGKASLDAKGILPGALEVFTGMLSVVESIGEIRSEVNPKGRFMKEIELKKELMGSYSSLESSASQLESLAKALESINGADLETRTSQLQISSSALQFQLESLEADATRSRRHAAATAEAFKEIVS